MEQPALSAQLTEVWLHRAQLTLPPVDWPMFQRSYWLTCHVTCRCHDNDTELTGGWSHAAERGETGPESCQSCSSVAFGLTVCQWRSKALSGPGGSTVTWGPSVASARRAEAGSPEYRERWWCFGKGLLPGLGSGVYKLPQWGSPAAKGFDAFCVFGWPLLLLKTLRVLCKSAISHILLREYER